MRHGRRGHRINPPGHAIHQTGEFGRGLRGRKFNHHAGAHTRRCGNGTFNFGLECLIEGLPFLVQDNTQTQPRQFGLHPLPDQRGGVIANLARGFIDALGRIFAHPFTRIQNAVHGGGRNPRSPRDIMNCGAARHGELLTKNHQSLISHDGL